MRGEGGDGPAVVPIVVTAPDDGGDPDQREGDEGEAEEGLRDRPP